ncbi:MAG TPA: sulfotransferase [Rhizomicrobium sp.]|jgi:tetratricopeptide (TPR) repeat protein|nr:sulfotransferase [Rhizomicrobium sp.]
MTSTASSSSEFDFDAAADALRSEAALHHPRLREAVALVKLRRFGAAVAVLQGFRKAHPRSAEALQLLAEIAEEQGRHGDAVALFAECIALAPDFNLARYGYACALIEAKRPDAALAQARELVRRDPRQPLFLQIEARALEDLENHAAAAEVWHRLVEAWPSHADLWTHYARVLRGMGATEDCIAAYRKAIACGPSYGLAWQGLADLKTFHFTGTDVEQMERQLPHADLPAPDRIALLFALGKAYADMQRYDKSFANYAKGNALEQLGRVYDASVLTAHVARCKRLFTADFFHARAQFGCASTNPVFIVGMPRAGSTLVEQILASHSQIEGATELPIVATIAGGLKKQYGAAPYPELLATLDAAELKRSGEAYLEAARTHRKHGKPFFTDKMGGNFFHIGLIHLMLPEAGIVDVRRHPLACGVSNFVQMFASEMKNASRLSDIGQHYRDYVELMAHFERARPGKILRVLYEDLVLNPEAEIRRLLAFVGVPFEEACLAFHETKRVLTTASSEQVRRPLYRDALEYWRNYEPWLGPLKAALGPVLDAYPAVPAFD